MPSAKDSTAPALRRLTDQSLHDLVLKILRQEYPGEAAASNRLLDAPCGTGILSLRMKELGFQIRCADIDPGHFALEGEELIVADLNKKLPIEDSRFDVVVSVAGLQRLITPEAALREFHRVLQPGGRLFLGLPNFADLRRRLRYLFYGTIGSRFDRPRHEQTISDPEAHFRFPLPYPRVERMLEAVGFSRTGLHVAERSAYPYVLFPFSVLAWLMSRIRALKDPARCAAYRRSSTFAMLGSKSYVLVAEKR